MSPQMGRYTLQDDIARMAAHVADPDAHHSEEIPEGRFEYGGTIHLKIPGLHLRSPGTAGLLAGEIYYSPVYVNSPITLANLFIEVTIAAGAGDKARLAIYNADRDWQPTTLVIETAQVAIDAVAVVSVACAVTLPEGRYLSAIKFQADATIRKYMCGDPFRGLARIMGATPLIRRCYVAGGYVAFADPGVAWDTVSTSNGEIENYVLLDISVP